MSWCCEGLFNKHDIHIKTERDFESPSKTNRRRTIRTKKQFTFYRPIMYTFTLITCMSPCHILQRNCSIEKVARKLVLSDECSTKGIS